MGKKSLYSVIFLVTAATLLLELAITRVFSVLMYYHFAFVAISVALFGVAASGLYLFLGARRFAKERSGKLLFASLSLMVIAVPVNLWVVIRLPIQPDFSTQNLLNLALIYTISIVPFFFSGLAVAMILFFWASDISRLYFFDLAGAACGALITIPLLNLVGGVNAQLVAVVLVAVAAVIAARQLTPGLQRASILLLVATVALVTINTQHNLFELRYLKGVPRENIVFEKWNSFSLTSVIKESEDADFCAIRIDGDAETLIMERPFVTKGGELLRDPATWMPSLPNQLLEDSPEVLIIGGGGGIDVVCAIAFEAGHVDVAEINPIIASDIMRGEFAEFSGHIYQRPDVDVHVAEGRSFISRSDRKYDMIQLTLVDSWAATAAGAFSLSENNLYTTEAFVEYLSHLKENGVLAITRWLFPRPRQTLRLMTTATAAARELGISDPEKHIAIAATGLRTDKQAATFIFKRSPLSEDDLMKLSRGRRLIYSNFGYSDNPFSRFARASDQEAFIRDYEFAIEPATDNRPFFFNTLKRGDLARLVALEPESRKVNLGVLNLFLIGAVAALLVLGFLVLPLLFARSGKPLLRTSGGIRSLIYFVAIGLGFILVEIALMQLFVLYLGHPIFSLTVVLFCLLVTAGLGSWFTQRYDHRTGRRYGWILFPAILVVLLLLVLLLPVLVKATFALPLAVRIGLSFVVLSPLGFLLGQPFPIELKLIEKRYSEIIPWAWGLNGAASVLGSVGAIAIAMYWGFSAVLGCGIACYLIALAARGRATMTA